MVAKGLVLSTFTGAGLLDRGFRQAGYCVVSAGDPMFGQEPIETAVQLRIQAADANPVASREETAEGRHHDAGRQRWRGGEKHPPAKRV